LKIFLVVRSLDVGGTERQLLVLARGLALRGHHVTVAVFYPDGALEKQFHSSGLTVLNLAKSGRWNLLSFFLRALRAVRGVEPDVLYGFLTTANILAVFLKPFLSGTRTVWGIRSAVVDLSRYDWLSRLSYKMESKLSRFADLIICNSRAGRDYAVMHGYTSSRMTVVPNGIDTEYFKPDLASRERIRREWGINADEILIGLVGRLDPMKDHQTFLQAAALISRERPEARFVCVGDGTKVYAESLYRVAHDLGLDRRLLWIRSSLDVMAVYNALDVLVSSSSGEGFPNVVGEAMACGIPCVVTNVGDCAEIVGKTGEVVPARSPEALCQGVVLMLTRVSVSLGRDARARIVEYFSQELLISRTIEELSRSLGALGDERAPC